MEKMNFAVWNIDRAGAAANGKENSSNARISRLLEKKDLDFIFLQEVPDPSRIQILSPSGNKWQEPTEDSELKQVVCKCLYKDGLLHGVWIPRPGYHVGILFLLTDNGRKNHLGFRSVESITEDPIGMVCSIFHEGKPKDDLLRFIGYWNNPNENTAGRSDCKGLDNNNIKYLQSFLNFLDGLDNQTPPDCILTGDTNVIVRTDHEKPGTLTKNGKFLEDYLEKNPKIKLSLIHGNADQCTLRSKSVKDKQTEKPRWYRCDLLMASDVSRISCVVFGNEEDYMWAKDPSKDVENAGSDHRPLFFSFSYDV